MLEHLRGARRSRPNAELGKFRGRLWGLGDAGEGWLRETSSYCWWVLSGPPGILGQCNGPCRANEDPRSLWMRWTKSLVN